MIQDRMMRIRTIMRMGPRRTLKQTQRLKGRVTRTMIQNGMKILDKYEDVLKKNLEADTKTEGESDEDDDPG